MAAQLLRFTVDTTAGLLERSRLLHARFRKAGRLRILCYHGVCADADAGQAWVPRYFVPVSLFAEHLRLLQRYGRVVFLPEQLAEVQASGEACTAVTFDDVPACTHQHALPVLQELGVRASFFIATGYAASGRLFPADVLHLLRQMPELASPGVRQALRSLTAEPARHKRMRLAERQTLLAEAEAMIRESADPRIVAALRCMNWDEVRTTAERGHEIGGHTVDHAILGWQDERTRRAQILRCVKDITVEVGVSPVGFAYPNGGPGDFGEADKQVLKSCGVQYALSTEPGSVSVVGDRYALPRSGVGMQHATAMLAMELSGALDARRRAQAGWPVDGEAAESPAESPEPQTRAPASMRPEEYAVLDGLLARYSPKHTLEIGMATGGSSERICRHLHARGGGTHIAIDPFQFAPEGWAGAGVERLEDAGLGQYLQVIDEPDLLALPELVRAGRRFDFVLIDGWHSFDYTFLDLFYADLLLKPGGVLAIHDTNMPAVHRACRFVETHKEYVRIGPPIAVTLPSLEARGLRRLRQVLGGPAAWRAARQRRGEWYALAAYEKQADGQVGNDFYAPF